jgi:predicted phosphodiesterase
MRIRVLSDLHLEVRPFEPGADGGAAGEAADVVVLAGDICNGDAAVAWAAGAFNGPVLYVPGNHEYYDGEYHAAHAALHAACGASDGRVTLLDCTEWIYRGVRFLGCTLWADFSLLEEARRAAAMDILRRCMPDYRVIRFGNRHFQPEDSAELCLQHRNWLTEKLDQPFAGATVVVTHFVPNRGSIAPQFADDFANPAFIVPLDDLMGRAKLWIHGHTHTHFDYTVNGTRIVANPRGYPREQTGFKPGLLIEVPNAE